MWYYCYIGQNHFWPSSELAVQPHLWAAALIHAPEAGFGGFFFHRTSPKARPKKTKAPEGFPRSKIINRPQRRRCRFLQALCLIIEFSFYLGFGLIPYYVLYPIIDIKGVSTYSLLLLNFSVSDVSCQPKNLK
jgi:hypothetical protein